MSDEEIFAVLFMVLITIMACAFFVMWNRKFEQKKYDWRVEQLGGILYGQAEPSWSQTWEQAEPLVRESYMNKAKAVLAFTDRTVTRT